MQDTTEYFYCLLVANVYSCDEYGNMEDYPDEYDGSYLASYEERIRGLIHLEDARYEDNLAAYFDGATELSESSRRFTSAHRTLTAFFTDAFVPSLLLPSLLERKPNSRIGSKVNARTDTVKVKQ